MEGGNGERRHALLPWIGGSYLQCLVVPAIRSLRKASPKGAVTLREEVVFSFDRPQPQISEHPVGTSPAMQEGR